MPEWDDPGAGDLRHRVVIQSNTPTRTLGVPADSWSDYAECWALMTTTGGREFREARQANTELSHEIIVRWREGVTNQMRVKYEDPKPSGTTRYFQIVAVVDRHGRDFLRLHCREVAAGEWRAE